MWSLSAQGQNQPGKALWKLCGGVGGYCGLELAGATKVEIDAARVHYGEIDLLNMHGGQ